MLGQEDYNEFIQDEDHALLKYIARNIEHPRHEDCVYLKLTDFSDAATEYISKRYHDNSRDYCWVEVRVTPDDIKEIYDIMKKLLKKTEERGYY